MYIISTIIKEFFIGLAPGCGGYVRSLLSDAQALDGGISCVLANTFL